MAACDIVLPHGGIVFGVDVGFRGSQAERFASTSLMTASLGGVALLGPDFGRGLMPRAGWWRPPT
jgi:hypothetical protein